MKISFFGSSLLSAYWNGAATYYRGIIAALHKLGYRVTFYEPDAYNRQQHRDIEPPDWAEAVVYPADEDGVNRALCRAIPADWLIKASGVGVNDELLEREIVSRRRSGTSVAFWDVDAPATLDRMDRNPGDPFHAVIREYDLIFTYGGGEPVRQAYLRHGARECIPIYNALDPATHHPVEPRSPFHADLSFLGNRLPDREARADEFFFRAAGLSPSRGFLLGGNGWQDRPMPPNVRYAGHVYTADHNAFNCSARAVLNISRESMARYGFSPATRVFEAAGAGACLITDAWEGVETFFEPGKEILVAANGAEVGRLLNGLTEDKARAIGRNAYQRAVRDHTYAKRALQVDAILQGRSVTAGR